MVLPSALEYDLRHKNNLKIVKNICTYFLDKFPYWKLRIRVELCQHKWNILEDLDQKSNCLAHFDYLTKSLPILG